MYIYMCALHTLKLTCVNLIESRRGSGGLVKCYRVSSAWAASESPQRPLPQRPGSALPLKELFYPRKRLKSRSVLSRHINISSTYIGIDHIYSVFTVYICGMSSKLRLPLDLCPVPVLLAPQGRHPLSACQPGLGLRRTCCTYKP